MWIIIVVLLILMFAGAPFHGYSSDWGYGPSGFVGLIVLVLVVLLLLGRL